MDTTNIPRVSRLCGHCEHASLSNTSHPCEPCYGTDTKPNFEQKVKVVRKLIPAVEHNALYQRIASAPPGAVVPVPVDFDHSLIQAMPANPKQAFGDKKPPLHLIHSIAQLHESAALHSGRRKYGENNYLESAVEAMTYLGAILRHTSQYISGERVDRKELVHHMGAVKACATIILAAEATGMLIDNRPTVGREKRDPTNYTRDYQEATEEAFEEVTKIIEHLNELYPNPK